MFFWAVLEKNIPFLLNFSFTILIARLVSPEAYGLVAMTAMLTALGTVFQNMGFAPALIQRKELTENDTTTVFIANVSLSAVLALVLLASAHQIAGFFGRPEVVTVVRVNAATLFLAAFGLIQMAMLQRDYRFRAGLAIEVVAILLAGCTALVIALSGRDLTALLSLLVVREGARTALLWILIRWRPKGSFSLASLRSLWGYARHMIGASIYHHIASNLASLLLGKYYSATTLGLFGRAQSLQSLPVGLITQPVQRVAFPLYSRNQDDRVELRRLLRSQSRTISVLAGTVTAGLVCCSAEIVLILVGEAWAESIPMLRIFALAAFFNIMFPLHSEANKAIGKSRWFFWVEFTKKTLLVIWVLIGIAMGVEALIWALVLSSVADYLFSAMSSVRFIGYSWREQFSDLAPSLAVAAIAVGAALGLDSMLPGQGLFAGFILKGGAVVLVFAAAILLARGRYFAEVRVWFLRILSRLSGLARARNV